MEFGKILENWKRNFFFTSSIREVVGKGLFSYRRKWGIARFTYENLKKIKQKTLKQKALCLAERKKRLKLDLICQCFLNAEGKNEALINQEARA